MTIAAIIGLGLIALALIYIGLVFLSFAGIMARWLQIPPEKLVSKKVWKNMQPQMQKLHELPREDVQIKSRDGLNLVGHWIPGETAGKTETQTSTKTSTHRSTQAGAQRTVLMCHGWRSDWDRELASMALWLHEQNCNLMIIEQRAQGNSGGRYMTFGLRERFDCVNWANWCARRCPELPLYLYGASMGAATVLMATGEQLPKQVRGVISDCGFTSPYKIIRDVSKRKYYTPEHPFMDLICFFADHLAGVDLRSYSARKALRTNRSVPVIFMHGTADNFVPCRMSRENYEACESEKELHLFEGAGHCGSYRKYTQRYQRIVLSLFERQENP